MVCEDMWTPEVAECLAETGSELLIVANGSPFEHDKPEQRLNLAVARVVELGLPLIYVNQVGGQDELVFDGGSMVLAPDGSPVARAAMFEEELLVCDLDVEEVLSKHLHPSLEGRQERASYAASANVLQVHVSDVPLAPKKPKVASRIAPEPEDEAEVYQALVLATRDYLHKTGFTKALIALSGGVDSSLVATVAVDALGAENVVGVSMPSRYSSEGSIKDAQELADNLGVRLVIVPIEPAHAAYLQMLERPFEQLDGGPPGTAEENIQARIRGNVIMALSNKFGWIVLTTGNKSEFATGYTTLYGDMSGGYAVIKDVPKTLVYRLSRYRNTLGEAPVIPEAVLTKPPSAELKPGQLDQDTLPPYEILDPIIEAYVEEDRSVESIVEEGYDRAIVEWVVRTINRNEYKRRQSPPGVKITPKAFGRDRRLPIASRYKGS